MNRLKKYWILLVITFVALALIKPALCFVFFGLLISYFGFAAISQQRKISKAGIDGDGRIVEYQTDRDGDKTPVIEFLTAQGDIVRGTPFIYSSTDLDKLRPHNNLIDQSVAILYDPDEPEKFILRNEKGLNSAVFGIFIFGGLVFIAFGVGWLLGYIKMR